MSIPKLFIIKETESEIKKLIKSSTRMLSKRFQALLIFKRYEKTGISKRQVANEIGVNHNSIQTWRSAYISGGVEQLKKHSNIGYKPCLIKGAEEKALGKKLNDPNNGIVGFVELLDWFNTSFNTDINYKTFHGIVVRKFKAKIKVARKSHVKKDEEAVDAFKKTLIKSAKKSSVKTKKKTKL
jgi:transposase